MAKTSRLGLNITPSSENSKAFKIWRDEIAGDGTNSNMMIIDREVGSLQDNITSLEDKIETIKDDIGDVDLPDSVAPKYHASATTEYGAASGTEYGHVISANNLSISDQSSYIPYHYIYSAGSVNLNSYISSGEYTFYNVTTATGFPSGTWTGTSNVSYLEVKRFVSNTSVLQVLYKQGTTEVWMRYCTVSTSWGDWVKMSNTAEIGNTISTAPYAICDSIATTTSKVVTLTGFTLTTGATIDIKFTYGNTVAIPAINVNGTGSKSVSYRGGAIATVGQMMRESNRIYRFIYTGSSFEILNPSPIIFTATLAVATWTGTAAPYTYNLTFNGLLEDDVTMADVVPSDVASTALDQIEAWGRVSRVVSSLNTLKLYCYKEKPGVAIPIQVRVAR